METRWRPRPKAWPADLRLRIVALADVHMGPPHMTPARLEAIVARAAALQGDLVVLLGDYAPGMHYVSGRVAPVETARILATLRAPLGTWAVLGNHDWADDPAAQERGHGPTRWHAAMQEAGIPVLENRAVRLDWQGRPFWLAGLGSQWAFDPRRPRTGVDDLDAALAATLADEAPAILLAHEPDIFPAGAAAGGADAVRAHPWRAGADPRLLAGGAVAVRQPLCLRACGGAGAAPGGFGRARLLDRAGPLRGAAGDHRRRARRA